MQPTAPAPTPTPMSAAATPPAAQAAPAALPPALSGPLAALAAASDALAALVAHVGLGTVGVNLEGRGDGASGTVWRPGIVVTVAHPLGRGRRPIRVTFADGHTLAAELVGIDHATDLAVLRLPAQASQGATPGTPRGASNEPPSGATTEHQHGATPVTQGSADHVVAGHFVVALGRSVRGDTAASAGIVHRTGAAWQTWTGGRIDRLIRLDGGLFDGLSGGPVCDAHGHVVGLANGALARGGGVVVPTATVDRVVDALLTHGHVVRPYLGIVTQPVRLPASPADAARQTTGLLVTGLDETGPAARAGLIVGDILHAVDGTEVSDLPGLRQALASQHSGATVSVGVLRAGQPITMSLIAGEAPAPQMRGCR